MTSNTGALAALAALAQQSRLAIFRYLVTLGPAGICARSLAGVAGARRDFYRRLHQQVMAQPAGDARYCDYCLLHQRRFVDVRLRQDKAAHRRRVPDALHGEGHVQRAPRTLAATRPIATARRHIRSGPIRFLESGASRPGYPRRSANRIGHILIS